MKEFRCTRDDLYNKGDLGYKNKKVRHAYYIKAETEKEALEKLKEKFPDEESFSVELWSIKKDGEWKTIGLDKYIE